ncbi:MAG: hypothetical protein ACRC62_11500 [Microcoleus sp.]
MSPKKLSANPPLQPIDRRQLSIVNCQLLTVNCQLSTLNYLPNCWSN